MTIGTKEEKGRMGKKEYFLIGLIIGIAIAVVAFITAQNNGFARGRANYQGILLSVEENKAYKAVVVLAPFSNPKSEGDAIKFSGESDMKAVGGKKIEAGEFYVVDQGSPRLIKVPAVEKDSAQLIKVPLTLDKKQK